MLELICFLRVSVTSSASVLSVSRVRETGTVASWLGALFEKAVVVRKAAAELVLYGLTKATLAAHAASRGLRLSYCVDFYLLVFLSARDSIDYRSAVGTIHT